MTLVLPHRRRFAAFGATMALAGQDEVGLELATLRTEWLGWSAIADGPADVNYELTTSAQRAGAAAPAIYGLQCDGLLLHASSDLTAMLDAFEDHAKLQTACRAEGRLFVHAGAVSCGDIGIIIPGRSCSGKSTLIRALVAAGAVYYSDEFAVLDAHGRMHPYPLPLSIRASGAGRAARIPVESIGGRAAAHPVDVGLIAVTRYRRCARWRPREITAGEALLALMGHTVAARRVPATAMAVLKQTVLGARAVESLRGEAHRIAAALLAEAR